MGRKIIDRRKFDIVGYSLITPTMFRSDNGEVLWKCRDKSGVKLVKGSHLKRNLIKERK